MDEGGERAADRQPDDDGYAPGETAVLGAMFDEAMGREGEDAVTGFEEDDDLEDEEPGDVRDYRTPSDR